MGLLARGIEAAGVTTVCLALVRELAMAVKAPRMVYLRWPFGHALGEPGNRNQQHTILHDMFAMAQAAPRPGLVVELSYRWKREVYPEVSDWTAPGEIFAQGLVLALEAKRMAITDEAV